MYQERLLAKGIKEHEYLAYIGSWGAVIVAAETLLLELPEVKRIHTIAQIFCVLGYGVAAVLFYACTPSYIKHFGATLFNMSLIPTMVYSLIFSLLVYNSQFNWLYLGGYVVVILGLSLFSLTDKPQKASDCVMECESLSTISENTSTSSTPNTMNLI